MSDREDFEKWAQPKGYLLEKLEDNRASYEFDDTHNAWEGYQAATKAQQAKIAELEAMVKVKDEALKETLSHIGRSIIINSHIPLHKSIAIIEKSLATTKEVKA